MKIYPVNQASEILATIEKTLRIQEFEKWYELKIEVHQVNEEKKMPGDFNTRAQWFSVKWADFLRVEPFLIANGLEYTIEPKRGWS